MAKDLGFDVSQLDGPQRSWAMLLVGAGLLLGGYLYPQFAREPEPVWMVAITASARSS